jgi:hypothetical protein
MRFFLLYTFVTLTSCDITKELVEMLRWCPQLTARLGSQATLWLNQHFRGIGSNKAEKQIFSR